MSSEQPKPNNQAVNLYGAFNEELQRMHDLVKMSMQQPHDQSTYHSRMGGYHPPSHHTAELFWQRIIQLQDIMIAALQSHDPLIQEKVAELALMGVKNEG